MLSKKSYKVNLHITYSLYYGNYNLHVCDATGLHTTEGASAALLYLGICVDSLIFLSYQERFGEQRS